MTECKHLLALRRYLYDYSMEIWSEHGEEPAGWVNVSCPECRRTYEVVLRQPHEGSDD